jgi:hypothetical protein
MISITGQTASEHSAAAALDCYFRKIAGDNYNLSPIDSIVIRQCGTYGDDGFSLETADGCLFISGGKRGVIYGAYTLLEDYLGCRFYAPGVEKVPKYNIINIPEIKENIRIPVVRYRNVFWYSAFDENFSVKQKINGAPGRTISDNFGGTVNYAGNFVHTLGKLAEMEGDVTDRQPCLSDETVFNTVLRNVRSWLNENTDAKIISVSQNDSHAWSAGCTCPRCSAIDEAEGTPMGSLLTFINRLADALKSDYPDVMIDTLAYRYTRKAPKTLTARDNVIIRLCSIECCFSHPADICDAETDRSAGDSFADTLRRWSEICKNVYIWDYTTNFAHYAMTFPNFNVLRHNIRFFADNNVTGIFEQGNYSAPSGEFGELRSYLLAKCLWDPYMTDARYSAHMDDFLEGYYGSGWRNIRAFIDAVQEKVQHTHFGIYTAPFDILSHDESFCAETKNLWNAAHEKAEDEATLDRINKSYIQIEYYNSFIKKDPGYTRQLHRDLKKYNIFSLREGGIVKDEDKTDFTKDPLNW